MADPVVQEWPRVIGPLYFAYGHTFGGDSALYLFLGRPTDRNTNSGRCTCKG